MTSFNTDLIIARQKQMNISFNKLSAMTKKIDPEGKGVSIMTASRMGTKGYNPKVKTVILICVALDMSPKSCFTSCEKANGEI